MADITNEEIILYTFLIFFFIIILFLIAYNVFLYTSMVLPENVPRIKGDFAVQTNRSGSVSKLCGSNADSVCLFTNISTLSDAINTCNALSEVCDNFTYSDLTQIMNIISSESITINPDGQDPLNIYSRQIYI